MTIISRLFYAGAVEGQMPEILSMIQVKRMTPAPAVLVVVSVTLFAHVSVVDAVVASVAGAVVVVVEVMLITLLMILS
jgi:L-type amino acid transporter 8